MYGRSRSVVVCSFVVIIASALLVLGVGPARAQSFGERAGSSETVIYYGCQELVGGVYVPAVNVRPLVPASYDLQEEQVGKAELLIRAIKCAGSVDGIRGPLCKADVAVTVLSPDGGGVQNYYQLHFLTSSKTLTRLRHAKGASATYVPGLRYERTPPDVNVPGTFLFAAPDPAPSPFWIEASEPAREPVGIPFEVDF